MNYIDFVMPFLPKVIKQLLFIPMFAFGWKDLTTPTNWFGGSDKLAKTVVEPTQNVIKNLPEIAQEASDTKGLSQRELDLQEQALDLSRDIMERQLAISEEQMGIAKNQEERSADLWNVYKENYQPGEIAFSKELFAGIRPDLAVDRAVGDVSRQFGNLSGQQTRLLNSLGIDPTSGKAISANTKLMGGLASARAGAANIARMDTSEKNRQMKTQAVAMGQGYPSTTSNMSTGAAGIMGAAGSGQTQAGSVQTNLLSGFAGAAGSAAQAALNRQFSAEQSRIERMQRQDEIKAQERMQMWNSIGSIAGLGLGSYLGGGFRGGSGYGAYAGSGSMYSGSRYANYA